MRTRFAFYTLLAGSLAFYLGCGSDENPSNPSGSGGAGSSASSNASTGAGAGSSSSSTSTGAGGAGSCLASGLLNSLGKDKVLVGASMDDQVASQAPFDLRYLYLAGGIFDGASPCGSCANNCMAGGQSCANSNPNGCSWWGCWQYDQDPPGGYVRGFLQKTKSAGQIPMITYYEILHASGVAEGVDEVTVAANDQALMTRYLADFRFVLEQIGQEVAFLHIEPDFWGYAEQANSDPHALVAKVASANPTDCASQEDSIAGLGRCMIAMTRKYAPNAKIGLHASAWASKIDVYLNTDPSFDLAGEAQKVGAFLAACGAGEADYVAVEASDRDAGYYESIGQNRWWDDTNAKLPDYHQAFAWAKALAESVNRPLVWWQLPVGNMSLPGGPNKWKDNRVDYYMAHMDEIAAAHGAAVAFGAGQGDQTNPSTDGGNLVSKVNAYKSGGGQAACP